MVAPPNIGKSSDDWSLGSGGSARNTSRISANATPIKSERGWRGDGGRSIITTSGASRSAILPSSLVNLSSLRRPTTGLACVDRASISSSSLSTKSNVPIVQSVAYYQTMIQDRIDDIIKEMERLRSETEMADVHSEPRMALESRHDALLNTVRGLEGNVADYNLAKEHVRAGLTPGDIKKSALAIISSNKKMEKEIDAVFLKRNKVDDEISRVEAQVARLHAVMESKILDGDDEKMDGQNASPYNEWTSHELREELRDLISTVKAVIEETEQQEDDIVLIRHKLKAMESVESQRYGKEKKRIEMIQKQIDEIDEGIQLAQLADDEARERMLGKIVGLRLSTKELEEESSLLESDLKTLIQMQDMTRVEKLMGGSEKAHKRLFKKDNSCKQYLEQLRGITRQLNEERCLLLSKIQTLRDDTSKKEEWISNMVLPSREEMELMTNDLAYTRKNLDHNRETMSILHHEKTKRTNELAQVESIDQRIASEIDEIHKQTAVLAKEIDKFGKLGEMQDSARTTRIRFVDMNDMHARGIRILDNLLHESSSSHCQGMEIHNSSEWRELLDIKSNLGIQGRDLAKLHELGTDYGNVKAECLRLMDTINRGIISNSNHTSFVQRWGHDHVCNGTMAGGKDQHDGFYRTSMN